MLSEMPNYRVDIDKEQVIFEDGKTKPIVVGKKGLFFRYRFRKVYIYEDKKEEK